MNPIFTVKQIGNAKWQVEVDLGKQSSQNNTSVKPFDITSFLHDAENVAYESWGNYSSAVYNYVKEALENKEFQEDPQQYTTQWQMSLERESIQDIVPMLACQFIKERVLPKLITAEPSNNNNIEPKNASTLDIEAILKRAKEFAMDKDAEHVDETVKYVNNAINTDEFRKNPAAYMQEWDKQRGKSEEYRHGKDTALRFINEHVLPQLISIEPSSNSNVNLKKELKFDIEVALVKAKEFATKKAPQHINATVTYIKHVLSNVEFKQDPLTYMQEWEKRRGNTEKYFPVEDAALQFMKEYVMPYKVLIGLTRGLSLLLENQEFKAAPLNVIQNMTNHSKWKHIERLYKYMNDNFLKK